MPLTLFVLTLLLLFGLLSYYLIFSCLNVPQYLPEQNDSPQEVTLIICAKNEIENLRKNIPEWLNQENIEFELLVVNHHSSDESKTYLDNLAKKESKLKVIHIGKEQHSHLRGKRYPLFVGIENAKYDIVALSDADCFPSSVNHLKELCNSFIHGKDIVLGYSPYVNSTGFVNKLVQYETTLTALLYLSLAKLGFPYMGVGRNIAYRKSVLSEKVFTDSNKSTSGDDDLIIGEIANKHNTVINIHPDTHVYSSSAENFKQWMKQKQRHYSTARQYNWLKMILVGAFGAINLLFYISLLVMLLIKINPLIVLGLYLSKLFLFVMFNYGSLKMLKKLDLIPQVFYLDVFWVVFLVYNHFKALKANNGWS